MPGQDSGADAVRFAERVLLLLDQGQFTATYKFAVLLGLMDLCLEHTQTSGEPPSMVTTHQLAEKVVELYWPQTLPFEQADGTLRQNSGGQAAIITLIGRLRTRLGDPLLSAPRARLLDPVGYAKLVRDVEWKLVEMPLPKLQRIGIESVPFIYEIGWSDAIRRSEFNDTAQFDNRIRFVDRSAEHFVRLTGLLRPLIQRKWAAMVSALNASVDPVAPLEEYLFGASRTSLEPVRGGLLDLQRGRCFYCDATMGRAAAPHVDHFIPWSRYPNNGLDNLVVAHERCNLAKRDFLAATPHVERWAARTHEAVAELDAMAGALRWQRETERSLGVARGLYLGLADDYKLWHRRDEFERPDVERLRRVLAGVAA